MEFSVFTIVPTLSVYHNTHWHVFYKDLAFSAHTPVAVNCYTFDALVTFQMQMLTCSFVLVDVSCARQLSIILSGVSSEALLWFCVNI
jgi:hypothetical protein